MKIELLKQALEDLDSGPLMMTYFWDLEWKLEQEGSFTKQDMRKFKKDHGIRYIEIDGCGYWFTEAWFLRQLDASE